MQCEHLVWILSRNSIVNQHLWENEGTLNTFSESGIIIKHVLICVEFKNGRVALYA